MKVIITNDSLDSLLSVQISTNNGQSYSTYSVSSLKDGLTFDCSPKDLKVICDVNTLKYIQVLADGEKASSSDIDLSNYIKIKDIYVDVYRNYYDKELTEEEYNNLSHIEKRLYDERENYMCYCYGNDDFSPHKFSDNIVLYSENSNNIQTIYKNSFENTYYTINDLEDNDNYSPVYLMEHIPDDESYTVRVQSSDGYLDDYEHGDFYTNARVHFIKHF